MRTRRNPIMHLLLALLFGMGMQSLAQAEHRRPTADADALAEADIRSLLQQQQSDWNAGKLEAFMAGYAKSTTISFVSGGTVVRGWQTVFDRYSKRYADPAAMGKLEFSELEVTVLSADAAMVIGHFHQIGSGGDSRGMFTLILRHGTAGWLIVHDHTS